MYWIYWNKVIIIIIIIIVVVVIVIIIQNHALPSDMT